MGKTQYYPLKENVKANPHLLFSKIPVGAIASNGPPPSVPEKG